MGPQELESGDTVPASVLSFLLAIARFMGYTPSVLEDPGGPVFIGPGGDLMRPKATAYGTSEFEGVTSTPGTGSNGGGYTPASPGTTVYPFVHKQFKHLRGSGGGGLPSGADGDGANMSPAIDTTGETERMSIPGGSEGYQGGADIPYRVLLRGEGGAGGDARVKISARHTPEGGVEGSYGTATESVVTLGSSGQTVAVEGVIAAGGNPGGHLQVKLERLGADGSDTSTDDLNVLAIDVDVPVASGVRVGKA